MCSVCKKLGFWGDLECGSETERLSIGGKRRRRVEAREEESGATYTAAAASAWSQAYHRLIRLHNSVTSKRFLEGGHRKRMR